jgi:hypothetical protein
MLQRQITCGEFGYGIVSPVIYMVLLFHLYRGRGPHELNVNVVYIKFEIIDYYQLFLF